MERFHLWFMLIQLYFTLYPSDVRVERIEEVLLDAAEDPALELEYFAILLRNTDLLLGR